MNLGIWQMMTTTTTMARTTVDIVVILLALTYHIHPLPSLRLQLLDQANINIRQGQ